MFYLFWLLLFYDLRYIAGINEHKKMDPTDERYIMGQMMIKLAREVIINQNSRDRKVAIARYDNTVTAAFEIGYMTQVIQEHYRRMLDKWYSARRDVTMYYSLELALYLEEIEHLYWSIKHEVYMLHEIERKYKIKEDMNDTYIDDTYGATKPYPKQPQDFDITKKPKNIKPNKIMMHVKNIKEGGSGDPHLKNLLQGGPLTTKKIKKIFPHDYGWDIEDW